MRFEFPSEKKFFVIQKIDSIINHLIKAEKQVKKIITVQPELNQELSDLLKEINEDCRKLLKLRFKILNNGEEE